MLGISLGVMVLITVMSVMNGFEDELRTRILGMTPHVIVGNRSGGLKNWQKFADKLNTRPDVVATAPFIQTQGMLRAHGLNKYGFIQGIDPASEAKVSIVAEHMKEGSLNMLQEGEWNIILGDNLARNLGLFIGDKVTVIVVEGSNVSPTGILPRYRRFKLVGTFEVRAEMDSSLALIHYKDTQKLLRMGDKVTAVRLKVDDVIQASAIAAQIRYGLAGQYYVSDWTYSQGSLFRAVKMEKAMMFLLLTFIIAVAAFNIVSTLVMVVTDKQSDIAILKTFGATPSTIMGIFMVQGGLNGVIGTAIGVLLGIVLSLNLSEFANWLESTFGITLLPGDVYFIDFLPSVLKWDDVLQVGGAALLMALLATLYPSWRASKVKPAEALRYE